MAALELSQADLSNLNRLIDWLNSKSPLTEADIAALEWRRKALFSELLASQGQKTLGQVSGVPDIYSLPEAEFRAALKAIKDDLSEQVLMYRGFAERWFDNANMYVPPGYPDRIATILRKAKLFDLEKTFLAAHLRHFWAERGSLVDKKLAIRAKKIGLPIKSIPSNSPWYSAEEMGWAKELCIKDLSLDVKNTKDTVGGKVELDFEFTCLQCGGTTLDVDNPDNPESAVLCKDCKTRFGTWGAIQEWAARIGKKYVRFHQR